MKLAVLCESRADRASVRIIVERICRSPVEWVRHEVEAGGWPNLKQVLPAVWASLHFDGDTDGVVIVCDNDDADVHGAGDTGHVSVRCRRCELERIVTRERSRLGARPGDRQDLKVALGVAVPALEAWLLPTSEADWLQRSRPIARNVNNELKRRLYGADPVPEDLQISKGTARARSIDLDALSVAFPGGFALFAQEIARW